MKIRYLRSPNLRRLCLARTTQGTGKLTFLFDPQQFRGSPGRSVFSFVYRLRDKQMAVGIPDIGHRRIAEAVFKRRVYRGQAFGAQIAYEEKNGLANFEVTGRSGYYGTPTREQLEMAAEHIASKLQGPIIINTPDSFIVQAQLS